MSSYHLRVFLASESKKKKEMFMWYFILFLKNKIRAMYMFELEYMCCVFTFVQYMHLGSTYRWIRAILL